MNNYKIFETDEFVKRLDKISRRSRSFIENKLHSFVYPLLKAEPHFGHNIKKLTDYSPQLWRYRIRDYRIFYSINEDEKIVYLITIEMRKDSY